MAINYTYLFDNIRQYIKTINTIVPWFAKLDTAEAAIESNLVTAGQYDLISGVPESFTQRKNTLLSMINEVGGGVGKLLADKELCRGELPIASTSSASTILAALFNQMIADDETLAAGSITIGAVTADANNDGDATLLLDGILDGATAPTSGGQAVEGYALDAAGKWPGESSYAGRGSELSGADSYTVVCTRDSQTNRATEGSESFIILGTDKAQQPYDWRGDGAGQGALNMANGSSKLTNGEFETWSVTNTPDGWTLGTGAVVTDTIYKEVTNIKRGLYALQIRGKTATAAIGLSQAQTGLTPLKRYLVACWIKTSGTGITAGTLSIKFTGTSYTAGSAEQISLTQANLAALTSYTLKHFWVNMPESIPSDLALTIATGSTLTPTEKIYIDGMVLAEGQWFNGMCWGMVAGATPALRDDKYTFSVTASEGGVQKFFRRVYKMQLPSLAAASTITDTVTAFS